MCAACDYDAPKGTMDGGNDAAGAPVAAGLLARLGRSGDEKPLACKGSVQSVWIRTTIWAMDGNRARDRLNRVPPLRIEPGRITDFTYASSWSRVRLGGVRDRPVTPGRSSAGPSRPSRTSRRRVLPSEGCGDASTPGLPVPAAMMLNSQLGSLSPGHPIFPGHFETAFWVQDRQRPLAHYLRFSGSTD